MGSLHRLPVRRDSVFAGLPSKAVCLFAVLSQRRADTIPALAKAADMGVDYTARVLRMMLSRKLVTATGRTAARRWAVAS